MYLLDPNDLEPHGLEPRRRLEAILWEPEGDDTAPSVVLCHPHPQAGGTMHTKAVHAAARGFQSSGVAVLRFNFRGVGASTGKYDEGRGEVDDARVALEYLAKHRPRAPLWLAGFSFGSYVAMKLGAADPRVRALIAIAPPIDRYDFSFLDGCQTPRLFILAGNDELIDPQEAESFHLRTAGPKALCIISGAGHLFSERLDRLSTVIAGYAAAWPPVSGSRIVVGREKSED